MKTALILILSTFSFLSYAQSPTQFPIVSEDLSDRAIIAVMKENLSEIKKLVEIEKADPNFSIDGRINIFFDLLDASFRSDYLGFRNLNFNEKKAKILDYLVSKGAKPNAYDSFTSGVSPLYTALATPANKDYPLKDAKYIKWLLENGNSVNTGNISLSSGINYPSYKELMRGVIGHKDWVKVILDAKPDYLIETECGDTGARLLSIREGKKIAAERGYKDFVVPAEEFYKYVSKRYFVHYLHDVVENELHKWVEDMNRICPHRN